MIEGNIRDPAATVSGSIGIADGDGDNDPDFANLTDALGDKAYGSFALTAASWTYTLNQVAVQFLDAADSAIDRHTFVASDGSTQEIVVTISGTADAPVTTGISGITVNEDAAPSLIDLIPPFFDTEIGSADAGPIDKAREALAEGSDRVVTSSFGLSSTQACGFSARLSTATAVNETEIIPISRNQLEQIIDNADPLLELPLNSLVRRRITNAGRRACVSSANISARQLCEPYNVDSMIAMIRNTGVDPSTLKIEITEGLLLDDPETAIIAFNRFKAPGVTIALDGFGTGYSSLSYVHRFPLDALKIDRSFVMSTLKSRESMTVIRTITRLARDLNLSCVSEGIEDPHELTTFAVVF